MTRSHFLAKKGKADKNILKNSAGRGTRARREKEPGPSSLKSPMLLPALRAPASLWSGREGGWLGMGALLQAPSSLSKGGTHTAGTEPGCGRLSPGLSRGSSPDNIPRDTAQRNFLGVTPAAPPPRRRLPAVPSSTKQGDEGAQSLSLSVRHPACARGDRHDTRGVCVWGQQTPCPPPPLQREGDRTASHRLTVTTRRTTRDRNLPLRALFM